jgi:hypothetical protein
VGGRQGDGRTRSFSSSSVGAGWREELRGGVGPGGEELGEGPARA